jgi:hypothetical protein
MITCKDAVIDAMVKLGGVASSDEVVNYIYRKYPEKPWKTSTIKLHLNGLSDQPSAKHHPTLQRQACLHYLGNSKYELKRPQNREEIEPNQLDQEPSMDEDYQEATLSLERDLEEYLVRDLNCIEKGLKVFSSEGVSGRQYNTEVGRIDILAQDMNGDLVVIELKAGTAVYSVIGQILGYISCIRKTLAHGKKVRGIIIADDFDKRVKYAIEELPGISLKRYEVSFRIADAM